jgi:hypothetical protein
MLTENEILEQIGRATPIGIAIVLFSNAICFIVGSYFASTATAFSSISVPTIALAILGIADIGAGFAVKKAMLKPVLISPNPVDKILLATIMRKITLTISVICAMPPIYGLIAVFLGAQKEHLAAFLIISLAGYMGLRLRPRDFRSILNK